MNKHSIKLGAALLASIGLLSVVGAGCDTNTVSNTNTTPIVQPYQAISTTTTAAQDTQTQPSQTPPVIVFSHVLSAGSSGTEVASLQQFLADEGLYSGRDSGVFDQATTNAVIAFEQQQNILPADGIFGQAEETVANTIFSNHPDWVTTLSSNSKPYKNVDGSTVYPPSYTDNNCQVAGASAQCDDGTCSFSMHRSGTCSHHGGVSEWLNQ